MSIRIVVIALATCVMWSCGVERVTQLQETETNGQVGQRLSKLTAQHGALQAVVMFSLSQDGTPVIGAAVEFARSIAGRAPDYQWSGRTETFRGQCDGLLSGARLEG